MQNSPMEKPPPYSCVPITLQLSGCYAALEHQGWCSFSSANRANVGSNAVREGWIRRGDEKDLAVPVIHSKRYRESCYGSHLLLLHGFLL